MVMWADMLTSTADILGTSVEDGEVRYDLGDVRDDVGIAVGAASWGIDGFVSMPNDPSDGECARALYLVDGDEKLVIGSQDARYADKVGTLEVGDRAIISAGNQRFLMKQGNESITLYTVNAGKSIENSMMISACGEDGTITVANGGALFVLEDDGIMPSVTITAKGLTGQSFIKLTPEGVQIGGKFIMLASPKGQIGQATPGEVLAAGNSNAVGYATAAAPAAPVASSLGWTVSVGQP